MSKASYSLTAPAPARRRSHSAALRITVRGPSRLSRDAYSLLALLRQVFASRLLCAPPKSVTPKALGKAFQQVQLLACQWG